MRKKIRKTKSQKRLEQKDDLIACASRVFEYLDSCFSPMGQDVDEIHIPGSNRRVEVELVSGKKLINGEENILLSSYSLHGVFFEIFEVLEKDEDHEAKTLRHVFVPYSQIISITEHVI